MSALRLGANGLLISLCLPAAAASNAGIFYGTAGTVRLDKTEAIQLVTEEVTIVPGRGRELFDGSVGDWVDYSCRFTLKNLKDEPVEIQVGFPLTTPSLAHGLKQAKTEAELVESYGFLARDDDRTYHVRFVARDAEERFQHVFLWSMAFAAGESRELRVSYGMPMNFGMTSLSRSPVDLRRPKWMRSLELAMCEQFSYVTETGASWAGPIERATFRIHTTRFEHYLNQRPMLEAVPSSEPGAQVLSSPALLHRVFSLEGGHSFSDDRHPEEPVGLEWQFTPFKPGPSVGASYYLTMFPRRPDDMRAVCHILLEEEPSNLPEFREIVAAFFGVAATSPSVREFVECQIWYQPVNGKTEARCTEEERALLSAIDAAIAGSAAAARPVEGGN